MNDPKSSIEHEHQPQGSPQEMTTALFLNMVVQQTNMALMFLGQVPHPESGQRLRDLNAARMFIDQLEMIEVKTKGNLDKREEGLLKQSLTALSICYLLNRSFAIQHGTCLDEWKIRAAAGIAGIAFL